ncbi:Protein of unknown function [Sporobacter termitidis DSM 10068]|uniref:4 TMS phage holin, superfamily IV n=1 Tax=Sporobacter termitidis DSM 10068 TaxID=1123282 RepID=A0A1M5YF83_9FIRM|nr:DUF2512 family protein [Sporobacter termitidis]SHI10183.1 Protein of unknown function [Sporobacter termitidis DSM 10068]
MKHLIALLFKFIMVFILLEIMLGLLTALSFGQALVVSIAVTAVSYLIGDLLVLAFSNNIVATLCDAVLSFLTIYLFNYWSNYPTISAVNAVICALVLAIGEIFFHRFMVRTVYPNRRKSRKRT